MELYHFLGIQFTVDHTAHHNFQERHIHMLTLPLNL